MRSHLVKVWRLVKEQDWWCLAMVQQQRRILCLKYRCQDYLLDVW